MNLDVRKGIQSVKSTWSVLHSNLKACIPLPLEVNNKGSKMNKHTHTHTHTHKVEIISWTPRGSRRGPIN